MVYLMKLFAPGQLLLIFLVDMRTKNKKNVVMTNPG